MQSCKSLTKKEIQESVGNSNNCAEKQKKIIEKIRRENDILRSAISLLQNILQNEKNWNKVNKLKFKILYIIKL